jgi:hypothetical protein
VARFFRWIVIGLGLLLLATAAWIVVALRQADHVVLRALAFSTIRPAAWVIEQGLYRFHPTPEEIQDYNRRAGAELVIMDTPEPQARRLLAHYIAAGLDINRPNLESPLLTTALHAVTQYDHAWYTRVLLDFGARVDVRDAKGQTPLDWARRWQSRFPDDPEGVEKVRLLEAAERRQGRGSPPQAAASVPQAASMPR